MKSIYNIPLELKEIVDFMFKNDIQVSHDGGMYEFINTPMDDDYELKEEILQSLYDRLDDEKHKLVYDFFSKKIWDGNIIYHISVFYLDKKKS